MQTIPLCPEIVNGLALEDSNDDKGNTPECHKHHSTPQQSLYIFAWEHTDVEEDERQLQQCNLGEVERRHDVKPLQHLSDLLRRQNPDILTKTISHSAIHRNNGTRNCRDERDEYTPVIITKIHPRHCGLECEADNDESCGDDDHSIGQDHVVSAMVSNWSAAVGETDVAGH